MKIGEGSKVKSLEGFVSYVKEFGFYFKNIGDYLRVLRNLKNGLKQGVKFEVVVIIRSDSSQNQ